MNGLGLFLLSLSVVCLTVHGQFNNNNIQSNPFKYSYQYGPYRYNYNYNPALQKNGNLGSANSFPKGTAISTSGKFENSMSSDQPLLKNSPNPHLSPSNIPLIKPKDLKLTPSTIKSIEAVIKALLLSAIQSFVAEIILSNILLSRTTSLPNLESSNQTQDLPNMPSDLDEFFKNDDQTLINKIKQILLYNELSSTSSHSSFGEPNESTTSKMENGTGDFETKHTDQSSFSKSTSTLRSSTSQSTAASTSISEQTIGEKHYDTTAEKEHFTLDSSLSPTNFEAKNTDTSALFTSDSIPTSLESVSLLTTASTFPLLSSPIPQVIDHSVDKLSTQEEPSTINFSTTKFIEEATSVADIKLSSKDILSSEVTSSSSQLLPSTMAVTDKLISSISTDFTIPPTTFVEEASTIADITVSSKEILSNEVTTSPSYLHPSTIDVTDELISSLSTDFQSRMSKKDFLFDETTLNSRKLPSSDSFNKVLTMSAPDKINLKSFSTKSPSLPPIPSVLNGVEKVVEGLLFNQQSSKLSTENIKDIHSLTSNKEQSLKSKSGSLLIPSLLDGVEQLVDHLLFYKPKSTKQPMKILYSVTKKEMEPVISKTSKPPSLGLIPSLKTKKEIIPVISEKIKKSSKDLIPSILEGVGKVVDGLLFYQPSHVSTSKESKAFLNERTTSKPDNVVNEVSEKPKFRLIPAIVNDVEDALDYVLSDIL